MASEGYSEIRGVRKGRGRKGSRRQSPCIIKVGDDFREERPVVYVRAEDASGTASLIAQLDIRRTVTLIGELRKAVAKLQAEAFPRIHGYSLTETIGEGGFCRVFRAIRHVDESEIAVKVLLVQNEESIARFTREVEILTKLSHPKLVKIIDSEVCNPPFFYTMSVASGSLKSSLKLELLEVFEHVSSGVDFLHSQGLYHRDLKPGNILVFNGGARVSDLGLAYKPGSADSKLSSTNQGLGTDFYSSPEQLGGAHFLDPTTDVFSLGRILYWAITGEDSQFHPGLLSPNWRDLVEKACMQNPAYRHRSVREFMVDFRNAYRNQGVWPVRVSLSWCLLYPSSKLFSGAFQELLLVLEGDDDYEKSQVLKLFTEALPGQVANYFKSVAHELETESLGRSSPLRTLSAFFSDNGTANQVLSEALGLIDPEDEHRWVLEYVAKPSESSE